MLSMADPIEPAHGDFLELVERAKRGRLKVYLGYASGVGKTRRMLEEARGLARAGVEVVCALIEPHGRPEVMALLSGLEVLPRSRVEFRQVVAEDLDLAGVLARRPDVALIDEAAHTNPPGFTHRRRYQDILALIEAGINVICAFDIQHLESLNDVVERDAGLVVRETVPDTFLRAADQVIAIDLSIEDLLDRLRSGQIVAPERLQWALEHHYRPEALAALRELALREVAESVERASQLSRTQRALLPRGGAGRVMVAISPWSARSPALLRRGSRMAGRLNTDWYAVYVETPYLREELLDGPTLERLHGNIQMARELGAEVVRLQGHDVVAGVLDFAHSHRVAHIVVGRSRRPWWRRLLGHDLVRQLIDEASAFDVYILSGEERGVEL